MQAYSVFDIASTMFRVSGRSEIASVKLEKLMYYTFGWYGALTADALFTDTFYAMQHGPVVSELLAAHATLAAVPRRLIEERREAISDAATTDPYTSSVIEAVWAYYGGIDTWALRDHNHEDAVWRDAWESRSPDSRRARMHKKDIIDFFAFDKPMPPALGALLPAPQVSRVDEQGWERLLALPDTVDDSVVELFAAH